MDRRNFASHASVSAPPSFRTCGAVPRAPERLGCGVPVEGALRQHGRDAAPGTARDSGTQASSQGDERLRGIENMLQEIQSNVMGEAR